MQYFMKNIRYFFQICKMLFLKNFYNLCVMTVYLFIDFHHNRCNFWKDRNFIFMKYISRKSHRHPEITNYYIIIQFPSGNILNISYLPKRNENSTYFRARRILLEIETSLWITSYRFYALLCRFWKNMHGEACRKLHVE